MSIGLSSIQREFLKAILKNNVPRKKKRSLPAYICEGELYNCSICLQKIEVGDAIRILPCSSTANHKFHTRCIDRWLHENNTCPECRAEIY